MATVKEALNHFNTCPAQLILVMKKLLRMPAPDVWQFSELLVSQIKEFMRPEVNQMLSLFVSFEINCLIFVCAILFNSSIIEKNMLEFS